MPPWKIKYCPLPFTRILAALLFFNLGISNGAGAESATGPASKSPAEDQDVLVSRPEAPRPKSISGGSTVELLFSAKVPKLGDDDNEKLSSAVRQAAQAGIGKALIEMTLIEPGVTPARRAAAIKLANDVSMRLTLYGFPHNAIVISETASQHWQLRSECQKASAQRTDPCFRPDTVVTVSFGR